MIVTDPVVTLITLNLGFNFAVIFSWFISVPAVLEGVYGFTVQQVGLAFLAAVAGALLAALSSIIIDRLTYPKQLAKRQGNINDVVEYRLLPAMVGCFFITASLFWIGWTAKPTIGWPSPVLGTMLYVWGNLMVLVSTSAFSSFNSKNVNTTLTSPCSDRNDQLPLRSLPSPRHPLRPNRIRFRALDSRRYPPLGHHPRSVQ